MNAILAIGYEIGDIKLLEDIFHLSIDHLYMKANQGYLELSLNVNLDEVKQMTY